MTKQPMESKPMVRDFLSLTASAAATAVREFFRPITVLMTWPLGVIAPHAKPTWLDYLLATVAVVICVAVFFAALQARGY